jgi:hypothetical protein
MYMTPFLQYNGVDVVLYPPTRQHGVTTKKTTIRENLKTYIGICCHTSADSCRQVTVGERLLLSRVSWNEMGSVQQCFDFNNSLLGLDSFCCCHVEHGAWAVENFILFIGRMVRIYARRPAISKDVPHDYSTPAGTCLSSNPQGLASTPFQVVIQPHFRHGMSVFCEADRTSHRPWDLSGQIFMGPNMKVILPV